MSDPEDRTPALATLGMFIIDTFRFEDPATGKDLGDGGLGEHIGGGGTYFAIGARMWLDACQILMTVDKGPDLSQEITDKLQAFAAGLGCIDIGDPGHMLWRWRERKDGHGTTRAVNIYRGEHRGFEYLTPKIRLDSVDLLDPSPRAPQRLPRFIHCICSPQRTAAICDQVDELVAAGKGAGEDGRTRPLMIWEPIPDSAVAENLRDCLAVLPRVNILSPNHEEAASFLSVPISSLAIPSNVATANPAEVKEARRNISNLLVKSFLSRLPTQAGERSAEPLLICIRSGALGSVTGVQGSSQEPAWTEAYHDASRQGAVKDVTGAGNSFLGGFAAALVDARAHVEEGKGWDEELLRLASAQGSVSASFVVEQQGLPDFGRDRMQPIELWNGQRPQDRLDELLSRPKLQV